MSADSYLEALKVLQIREVAGVDAGYYQGDYFAAVMEDRYGYETSYSASEPIGLLVIGYGSCSGCDEWEGAYTAMERLDVLTRIVESIKWFDNLGLLKEYLASSDPKLEWYAHEEKWPDFLEKVNGLGDYTQLA